MENLRAMIFVTSIGLITLTGCASPIPSEQAGSMGNMTMSEGDMKKMCDKHVKMMGSMSAADQKAMMDEHMKDMSPEMREKQMKDMAMCK